eukprot:TCONS_00039431-protein
MASNEENPRKGPTAGEQKEEEEKSKNQQVQQQRTTFKEIKDFVGDQLEIPHYQLSHAATLRRKKCYYLYSTLRFSHEDRGNFDQNDINQYYEEKILMALKKKGDPFVSEKYLKCLEVKGKLIKIVYRDEAPRKALLEDGLDNIDTVLRFRGDNRLTFRITSISVPEYVTDDELKNIYSNYGEVADVYGVRKTKGGINIS